MPRPAPALFLAALAGMAAAAAPQFAGPAPAAALADDAAPVAVGAEAPDFALKDADGNEVKLSSYRGKKSVVVAFYPKAGSKLCTVEMKCLSTEWRKVDDRGAQVLAVSGDPPAALKTFGAAVGARFPLLSDTGFAVAKRYGVFTPSPDGGYAARSVFLVDREGKVRWISRDFVAPRTLEGTDLLAQIDLLRPAAADPADALSATPSPEKEAKTVLVRWVQALLAEDAKAADRALHPEFGWRPGYTPAMTQVKRDLELERVRKLFEAHDLRALAFADVLDPRDGRALAKGDQERPGAFAGFSEDARKAVSELPEGDLLLFARTKAPKLGETPLLARELWLHLRKDGEAWKILGIAGR